MSARTLLWLAAALLLLPLHTNAQPVNPRGWQAAQSALVRPVPVPFPANSEPSAVVQTSKQQLKALQQSADEPNRLSDKPQASSPQHSPAGAKLGILLLLVGFVLGWKLATSQWRSHIQLLEAQLQQTLLLVEQQQKEASLLQAASTSAAHSAAQSGTLTPVLHKLVLQNAAESGTTYLEASKENSICFLQQHEEQASPGLSNAESPTSEASESSAAALKGRRDQAADDASPVSATAVPSQAVPAAIEPSQQHQTAGTATAPCSLPPIADTEAAPQPAESLHTPRTPQPQQNTPSPQQHNSLSHSPAQQHTRLTHLSTPPSSTAHTELSAAAALVVRIHGELAAHGVPRGEWTAYTSNVLEGLKVVQQERQHGASSRLQEESNSLQRVGVAAAVRGVQLKSASAQRAMERARLSSFQASLSDDLTGGMCIMLCSSLWCAVSYGFLDIRLGRCRTVASLERLSFSNPFVVLQAAQMLWCWSAAAWQLLIGGSAMLGVAWLVSSRGWSADSHAAPFGKVLLGLGCVCGFIGFLAIWTSGGAPWLWLMLWESWASVHLLAAWRMPLLLGLLKGPLADASHPGLQTAEPWAAQLAFHASLAVVLPLATGVLPFWLALN